MKYNFHQVSVLMHFSMYSRMITKGSNNLNNIYYLRTNVELFFVTVNLFSAVIKLVNNMVSHIH